MTYDNKCRSFFLLLVAAKEGLDFVPDDVHLCVFVMLERVVKERVTEEHKDYVRSRKVGVFENAEKLPLMDQKLKTKCYDLVEKRHDALSTQTRQLRTRQRSTQAISARPRRKNKGHAKDETKVKDNNRT